MPVFGEDASITTPTNSDIKTGLAARGFVTANLLNWVLNLLHGVYESGIYLVTTLKPKSSTIEILDKNDFLIATIDDKSIDIPNEVTLNGRGFVSYENATDSRRYGYGKQSNKYPTFRRYIGSTGWDFCSSSGSITTTKWVDTSNNYKTKFLHQNHLFHQFFCHQK